MIPDDEIAGLLSRAAESRERMQGGNSIVVRGEWRGQPVAIKDYNARADAIARLNREWTGLRLLWSLDLRIAPQALGTAPALGVGIQEWVKGESPNLDMTSVEYMAYALQQLHSAAASMNDRSQCASAADAIRCVSDMRRQVVDRIELLQANKSNMLTGLLAGLERAIHSMDSGRAEDGGWIPTLSPSDFGTHNMLLDRATGTWRIIDLEFFGWDDAHKLVCDTLMHPLLPWSAGLASEFYAAASGIYQIDRDRILALYPWCSLKWVAITANRALREKDAGRDEAAQAALAAANSYLVRAVESYQLSKNPLGLETLLQWEPPR